MSDIPISLIVLTCNGLEHIARNLGMLLPLADGGEIELIVVDNASTDGTREYLATVSQEHKLLIVVANAENKGIAGGRNSGFEKATREFIVMLDNDTTIAADDIRSIPELFAQLPDAGLLSFRIRQADTGEVVNNYGEGIMEIANHCGAAFAIRNEVRRAVGGIHEDCNFGAEELDLAIRVHASGKKVLSVPTIVATHYGPAGGTKAPWRYQRRVYNFTRTYYRYLPRRIANVHAIRFWLSYALSWRRAFGLKGITSLIGCALAGRKAGITDHMPVPDETVRFYDNPDTRPDVGNVPIVQKLRGKHHSKRG